MSKKKLYAIAAAGGALLIAAALTLAAVLSSKTIKVAFYGVSEAVQERVKSHVDRMTLGRVRYFTLDAALDLPKNVQKKIFYLDSEKLFRLEQPRQKFCSDKRKHS